MTDVKALFPIGKTQWLKWRPEQQTAFNEARASGVPFADAVDYVNRLELVEVSIAPKTKKVDLVEVLHEVADAVATVSGVVAAAKPVVKTVKRAVQKKAK